jgi:flavin reductase (DIM6/NTAB) family NADH-FMN oxidoreductase RutF
VLGAAIVTMDGAVFRAVLGSFPTGVAIVTTCGEDGSPQGLACNAVCSVSAEPPLLLVCVDKRSRTLESFQKTGAFVVNILLEGRDKLANRFASKETDKFTEVEWSPSTSAKGSPILDRDILACAECMLAQTIDAGDHVIMIGQVESGRANEGSPLMYFRRAYAGWPVVRQVPAGLSG